MENATMSRLWWRIEDIMFKIVLNDTMNEGVFKQFIVSFV